ncbi:MAG: hypothetical protein V3S29_04050 [bacterium]
MRFWVVGGAVYLAALGIGLGFPALSLAGRDQAWWAVYSYNGVALFALLVATFLMTLSVARQLFPEFWWRAMVTHEDVYEYEGIYFVGARNSRQKTRINKAVFGVDEKMRPWDLLFGIFFLALAMFHLFGGYSLYQVYDGLFPERPKLAETLHSSALTALPVMREMKLDWSGDPAVAKRVEQETQRAAGKRQKKNPDWFRLAQLQLVAAFRPREGHGDAFQYSPGDRVFFDRNQGAKAVASLNRILKQPELERAGWTRGALALLGLYYLSTHDYSQAGDFFGRALAAVGDAEEAGITRFQIVLLAAQTAMLDGRGAEAEALLETILTDDRLPKRAYALATEHFAGAMRLGGRYEQVPELLKKAEGLYEKQNDQGGIARVHLRLAALAIEQGRFVAASREMSLAASLAHGLRDDFTLNMVEWLSTFHPKAS